MTSELRYTLLTDGASDEAFVPMLTWMLRQQNVQCPIQSDWADLRRLPSPPKKLSQRIVRAIDLYPCHLLFIHRDSEKVSYDDRKKEIETAINTVKKRTNIPPSVCVIPIRMQEAWLLFDENAIRRASGNPNGHTSLVLPKMSKIEELPNPKEILHSLIKEASGINEHRQKKLNFGMITRRVAEFVDDFSPLRALSAFARLENELTQIVNKQGWNL